MIRSVLIEIGLFALPFLIYALMLIVSRRDVAHPDSWTLKRVAVVAAIALVLVIASLIYLAHFSGAPPGSTYQPARVEDGRFIPGTAR